MAVAYCRFSPLSAAACAWDLFKEVTISPEYSLEGLILKLQYFGPPMENTPTLGKTEGRRKSR